MPLNSKTQPELILFDLDGTLVDSAPDLIYSINAMLEQLGLPVQDEGQIRSWVGRGAERLVKSALTAAVGQARDEAVFPQAFELFSEIYLANTSTHSQLYPGARETLDYLRDASYKLGCVTNKRGRFTEPLLQALGVHDDFGIVISGDTLPKMKPDPLPLLHAAQQLDVQPENTFMVGDSINDVLAARAAGMPVICVRYGYNHGENIEDAAPDVLLDSLTELMAII